jgi:hypothetical protein
MRGFETSEHCLRSFNSFATLRSSSPTLTQPQLPVTDGAFVDWNNKVTCEGK